MGAVSFSDLKVNPDSTDQFRLQGFGALDKAPLKPTGPSKNRSTFGSARSSGASGVTGRSVKPQRAEVVWLRQQLANLEAGKLSPAQARNVRDQATALALKAGSSDSNPWSQQEKLAFFGLHNAFSSKEESLSKGGSVVVALESMRHATRRSPTEPTDGSWSNRTKYWLLNDTLHAANQQFQKEGAFWSPKDVEGFKRFQKDSVNQLQELRPYRGADRAANTVRKYSTI